MTLLEWIKQQGTTDTVELLRRLYAPGPQISVNEWDEERPRDPFRVRIEKELLGIVATYGIAKQDSIIVALAKITSEKDELIFRMDFLFLRTLDVSGEDNETIHHAEPVYGPSPAEENGFVGLMGDDIEAAIRGG